ncbi:TPA: two-component system response regulator [Candidatus Marinimicrobia bacterium]|nr:MAG: Phosphate regulon transcriptional regulatory protein PhoB (SphR) [Marinimicrobia bacterium 46_47]KUK91381.1 MAG: two component transcriptional regulator [Marinimicrobia bacterium 46_43]HAE87027.1 two-component system response regulator [Candidatus Neomarinimicrobiota bacterium]HBY17999.1 two-component system response regulator [Candidatus Neomarinimicrobiota bacterium]
MNEKIAIVDDEADILELVSLHLKRSGFKVDAFSEGKSFYDYLKNNNPDLTILDLMLPDMDGLDICRDIRKDPRHNNMPVVMLTARGDETDTVLGLELGADDYVTKPFSPKELVARVKAVLRRGISSQDSPLLNINQEVFIDTEKYEVTYHNKPVSLTPTEFRILTILCERKGMVFSRDQILDRLWGNEKAVLDRTIDVHIKHIREKLGEAGKYISNLRGIGYKVEE